MRVLIISADNPYAKRIGGKHIHLLLLERNLKKLGLEVSTLYPPYTSRLRRAYRIILRDPLSLFSKVRRCRARVGVLSEFFKGDYSSFDVVNAHDVVAAYRVRHPNLVLTVHGYFASETVDYSLASGRKLKNLRDYLLHIEETSYNRAKRIIAVDKRIRRYIIDNFNVPKEKVIVIHNAVDIERFKPVSDGEKRHIRDTLGLGMWKWVVLIPRRFVPKNGVIYAAEAVKLISRKDVFFVFAGRGVLEGKLKNILRGLENVLIKPIPHDKIADYYRASDIVLIPSVTSTGVEEATSLSMLEGMACGKVVICTRVGGMKEVVKDGENGFLIEQKSPEAIAEKVEWVLNHYGELNRLRKKARDYVVKNHSPIEHSRKFARVYEEVLSG